MTRVVDGKIIAGARCSECGRRFGRIMDCYGHTVREHDRQAVPEILWTPVQPDLFDFAEGRTT